MSELTALSELFELAKSINNFHSDNYKLLIARRVYTIAREHNQAKNIQTFGINIMERTKQNYHH